MADIMLTTTGTQYQVVTPVLRCSSSAKFTGKALTNRTRSLSIMFGNGSVYQCPDLNTVIQSRMCAAVDSLNKAFMLVLNKARFSTSKGYSWSTKKKEKEDGETKVEEDDEMMQQDDEVDEQQDQDGDLEDNDDEVGKPNDQFGTYYQKARTTRLLQVLFEKFPPPIDGNVELRHQKKGKSTPARNHEDL
ncbi:hypothetical protein L596_011322 [Steinernema carpocapsae]|uniref:Uncharacterized protein n=1 Tax=Steinernema carpocapsae TaxID=34508 RepID=A0A4U5NUE4_STECR|nr:hypothetical protein L596_011322 [Steinernema carpocapsae]